MATAPEWLIGMIGTVLHIYSDDTPRRAGHLGAIKKYLKREHLFKLLLHIQSTGIDMTPTLAQKLLKEWVNRGANYNAIVKIFGTPGRAANNRSKDIKNLYEIAEQYHQDAKSAVAVAELIYQQAYNAALASAKVGGGGVPGFAILAGKVGVASREPLEFDK